MKTISSSGLSIKTNGPSYKTVGGRTVYGGGGIIPDIFVPRDTLGMTSYFRDAYLTGNLIRFAYAYVDDHRARLARFDSLDELLDYLDRQDIVEKFAVFAERNGLKRRNRMLRTSHDLFTSYLYGYIVDQLLDTEASAEYVNRSDNAVKRALDVIQEGATFEPVAKKPKTTAWFRRDGLRRAREAFLLFPDLQRPTWTRYPRQRSAES